FGKIRQQAVIGPGDRVAARHQYIVGARLPAKGKHRCGNRAQPALGAVAHDGTTDFLGGGEADTKRGVVGKRRRGRTDFQRDAGGGAPDAALSPQEIGADSQLMHAKSCWPAAQAESFLRPWARRRAKILRPPLVAMRARKPWRRLRT